MRRRRDLARVVDDAARARNADNLEFAPRGVGGGCKHTRDLVEDLSIGIVVA